jgi:hypothetical protein
MLDIENHHLHIANTRILNKLNNLYNGEAFIPQKEDKFINISNVELSPIQREVLNMGLNCHLQPKFDPLKKKMELEMLYAATVELQKQNKITIEPGFADALRSEGHKQRVSPSKSILTKEQRVACQSLRNNRELVIRKADKSNTYVLLNYADYKAKLDTILNDETKFKKIRSNPVDKLKTKLNKIINTLNAVQGQIHFQRLTGHFSPGYIYGNAKIHKNSVDPPLRPIISQVCTPTYKIAKQLNSIIQEYLPQEHSVKNREELLQILRSTRPQGLLASLDVESLFTNVPIETTIGIILQNTYHHEFKPPPKISKNSLESLLRICTTEAPFKHIDGSLYYQTEGIAMGSPLGPTFANFYMAQIENEVLQQEDIRPSIYARYVDDILVVVRDEEHLQQLQAKLQEHSILNFTYEIGYNKLPFLDIMVESSDGKYHTNVYVKETNTGECLNYTSECPEKYKISVINTFLQRAFVVTETWENFHSEVRRVKQLLVNNGYPLAVMDDTIMKFMDKKFRSPDNSNSNSEVVHQLFYQNQMNPQYKLDERVLKDIYREKIRCTDECHKVTLNIYYKNNKVKNLIMKNNITNSTEMLQKSNVVYKINCPVENCESPNPYYIGYTECTLTKRLTFHAQSGGPKEHCAQKHNMSLNRNQLIENTSIIATEQDPTRLKIYEALSILEQNPSLNRQHEIFNTVLKLHNSRPSSEQTTGNQVRQQQEQQLSDQTPLSPVLQLATEQPQQEEQSPQRQEVRQSQRRQTDGRRGQQQQPITGGVEEEQPRRPYNLRRIT